VTAKPWKLADPADFQELDLRVHALLADVPLHDVWQLDLPGGPPESTVDDVRRYMSVESLAQLNWVVRGLFGLRRWLGRVFGWDAGEESPLPGPESYLHRLTPEDRAAATAELGSFDGPFRVIYGDARERVGEIRNATVHAFSVHALETTPSGVRLFWAIYVAPVGRMTGLYMALIDPFRRLFVYPAILRHIHRSWTADHPRPGRFG
jgi:hypothetical protein